MARVLVINTIYIILHSYHNLFISIVKHELGLRGAG